MTIERNDVPKFVQNITYDYELFYFRVRYFDGTVESIDAGCIGLDLHDRKPTQAQYATVERMAEFIWKTKNCS